MTSFASRALLPVGLVVGIVSGCARAHSKSQGDMADTTPSTPSPPSSTVTAEDIQRTPTMSVEQLLMSRFPGVEVTRTAEGDVSGIGAPYDPVANRLTTIDFPDGQFGYYWNIDDRGMRIEGIRLLEKAGGKSGTWTAEG